MKHRRRLYWQIHLAFVGVVVCSVACAGLFGRAMSNHTDWPPPREMWAEHGPEHHLRLAAGLAIMAGVASILLYPVARRITRRLDHLGGVVNRWGEGDLAARACVYGNDEVADLMRGFNHSADRVQGLIEGQRRMLASASHELRSPLARLRMAVELMDDGSPERTGAAAEATRDIEELDALVGDLLLASRLSARPEPGPREAVDIAEIAREEASRASVSFDGQPAEATVDPRMIRRLVRNLLDNARRHAEGAESIFVRAEPGRVRITVLDRGPGVPEADRERIFEPFYRPAGHDEGAHGGVGLGLALVREIARHHGGDASYCPRAGGGSEFEVVIAVG